MVSFLRFARFVTVREKSIFVILVKLVIVEFERFFPFFFILSCV